MNADPNRQLAEAVTRIARAAERLVDTLAQPPQPDGVRAVESPIGLVIEAARRHPWTFWERAGEVAPDNGIRAACHGIAHFRRYYDNNEPF